MNVRRSGCAGRSFLGRPFRAITSAYPDRLPGSNPNTAPVPVEVLSDPRSGRQTRVREEIQIVGIRLANPDPWFLE